MLKPLTSVENVSPTSRIIEAIALALARVSQRPNQRDQQILLESGLLEPEIQREAAGSKTPATREQINDAESASQCRCTSQIQKCPEGTQGQPERTAPSPLC